MKRFVIVIVFIKTTQGFTEVVSQMYDISSSSKEESIGHCIQNNDTKILLKDGFLIANTNSVKLY